MTLSGFLFDGWIIQFFKWDNQNLILHETCEMEIGGEGGEYLFGLLYCKPEELGHPGWELTYKGKNILIHEPLGSGKSSIVYRGELNKQVILLTLFLNLQDIVVKRFLNNHKHRLLSENKTLELISKPVEQNFRGGDIRVPKVCGVSDDGYCLLLSPVGIQFKFLVGDMYSFSKVFASRYL